MYEVFEHTADLGLRVRAADLETLFAEAGKGLYSLIVDLASGASRGKRRASAFPADELDYLLLRLAQRAVVRLREGSLLFSEFTVTRDAEGISATPAASRSIRTRHELDHEVKAITYHGLKVEQESGGWLAEVIVDI